VAERPPDRLGTLRECRSAMRAHPSASGHAEGSGSGRCWGVDTGGIPLSPSEPEPHSEHARGASRSLGDPNPNSPVRNLFRSDYFKRRCEQQPSPNARETRPPRGASFAFCAAFSRGGPGRLGPRCLAVITAGSPGYPHWPTGWAESLSGSLRGRVPGSEWVGPAGAVTTPGVGSAGSVPIRCEM